MNRVAAERYACAYESVVNHLMLFCVMLHDTDYPSIRDKKSAIFDLVSVTLFGGTKECPDKERFLQGLEVTEIFLVIDIRILFHICLIL